MKRRTLLALLTVLLALLAGALAFTCCYQMSLGPAGCHAPSTANELEWLRNQYHLSDAQYERIRQLHAAFTSRCARMCSRVAVERGRLSALIQAGGGPSPEIEQALQSTASLELECRRSTLAHIYEVAAVMPPEEGRRYLATMTAAIIAPGMPGKAADCAQACDTERPR